MAFTAEYTYEIFDRYSRPLAAIARQTKLFQQSADKAKASAASFSKSLKSVGKSTADIGRNLTTRITLPLAGLGLLAGKTAADMQSGFIGVQKTVAASASEFKKIRSEFEKMSTEIPSSVEELYKIGEAAGQLGIKKENIISFSKTIAMLGATTNMAGDEGATQLARFANITQMSQDNFDRLGSTIVDLGNKLATTEAEITAMGLRMAAAGNVIGLTQDQIMSMAAAASSLGLEAEAGGTAFSRTMMKINDAVFKGGKELTIFAAVAGQSAAQFKENFKKDAAGSIVDFTEGLGKLHKEGKNVGAILEKLGMDDIRVRDAMLRAAGSGDIFRRSLQLGSDAWRENTALVDEAEKRFASWSSQFKIAWNKIRLLLNEFGVIIIPMVIKLTDKLMPLLQKFQGLSKGSKMFIVIALAIAAILPPIIIALGMMTMAIGALIPVLGMLAVYGVYVSAGFAPVLVTFGAVALAVVAVSAAVYQLIKNWEALTASGFMKDLGGWAVELASFGSIDAAELFNGKGGPVIKDKYKADLDRIKERKKIAADKNKALLPAPIPVNVNMPAIPETTKRPAMTSDIGTAPAQEKAKGRSLNNKAEITGNIRVSADKGSKVESAKIGLNTGHNWQAQETNWAY